MQGFCEDVDGPLVSSADLTSIFRHLCTHAFEKRTKAGREERGRKKNNCIVRLPKLQVFVWHDTKCKQLSCSDARFSRALDEIPNFFSQILELIVNDEITIKQIKTILSHYICNYITFAKKLFHIYFYFHVIWIFLNGTIGSSCEKNNIVSQRKWCFRQLMWLCHRPPAFQTPALPLQDVYGQSDLFAELFWRRDHNLDLLQTIRPLMSKTTRPTAMWLLHWCCFSFRQQPLVVVLTHRYEHKWKRWKFAHLDFHETDCPTFFLFFFVSGNSQSIAKNTRLKTFIM